MWILGLKRVNKILPTICCCKDIVNQNECVTCCIKCKVITKTTKKKRSEFAEDHKQRLHSGPSRGQRVMTAINGMTMMTAISRTTGMTGITGMTRITGITRMTGLNGLNGMTKVTGMSRMTRVIAGMTRKTGMTRMTGIMTGITVCDDKNDWDD